jgi:hypothetical protein
MTVPSSFPWVNYKMTLTANVNSTPTIVFGSDTHTCVLNNINVCNTSSNDILVYFYVLRIDVGNAFFKFSQFISKNTSQDLLNITTISGVPSPSTSELTLESGDILYGYSNALHNTFDCLISFAELLES